MKKVLLASAALLASAVSASAADLRVPIKAPPVVAPVATWSGFYIGGSVGARNVDADWTTVQSFDPGGGPFVGSDVNASFDSTDVRTSVYAGVNWQFAPAWLIGIEVDWGWANNNASVNRIPGLGAGNGSFSTFEATWDGGVRGRLGWIWSPAVLIFATGGGAWLHVEASGVCPADTLVCNPIIGLQKGSITEDRWGWTVGGGIEVAWLSNWLVRAEYRYADFGTLRFTALQFNNNAFGAVADVSIRTHTALVGLAYKWPVAGW